MRQNSKKFTIKFQILTSSLKSWIRFDQSPRLQHYCCYTKSIWNNPMQVRQTQRKQKLRFKSYVIGIKATVKNGILSGKYSTQFSTAQNKISEIIGRLMMIIIEISPSQLSSLCETVKWIWSPPDSEK